jgi:RNA polymerase sigma factor (sigma-70 family)
MLMLSDEQLIEGCKKGKHSAYEALYIKYSKRLMAIALRYSNTTFEAEDLVQETFIKIFERISSFDHKGSFEGWLKKVMVNNAINYYHKTSKERGFEDSSELNIANESFDDIFSKISNNELLEILKKLPFGYKTVFNLYVIEGYTHKEIGEICQINEGTSKSQLAKAKNMLKELLAKHYYIANG